MYKILKYSSFSCRRRKRSRTRSSIGGCKRVWDTLYSKRCTQYCWDVFQPSVKTLKVQQISTISDVHDKFKHLLLKFDFPQQSLLWKTNSMLESGDDRFCVWRLLSWHQHSLDCDLLCLMERCLWREVEQVEAVSRFSCRGLISVLSYASVSWSTKTRGWSWSWLTERNLSLRQHVVNKVNAEKSTKFKLRVTKEKACFCLKPTTISSAAAPSWMC